MITQVQSPTVAAATSAKASKQRDALTLEFRLEGTSGSWQPEASAKEKAAAEAQPISIPKSMTPEEKARVEFLQDQLTSLLEELAQNPTEEQQDKKARIREIEKELEKLTGIKLKSRLSTMAAKLPKEVKKDDEEERRNIPMNMNPATLAETIGTKLLPTADYGDGDGILAQMLRSAMLIPQSRLPGIK